MLQDLILSHEKLRRPYGIHMLQPEVNVEI